MTTGDKVINLITSTPLMDVECPASPESACLVVWRPNASEQIEAIIGEELNDARADREAFRGDWVSVNNTCVQVRTELLAAKNELAQAQEQLRAAQSEVIRLSGDCQSYHMDAVKLRQWSEQAREALERISKIPPRGQGDAVEMECIARNALLQSHPAATNKTEEGKLTVLTAPELTEEQKNQPSPVPVIPWRDYGNPRQG